MTFVLDSSVSLSWCFDDGFTGATGALMERAGDTGAIAPSHWPLEVLNGLAMAERRRRIDSAKRVRHIEFLRDLPVAIDADTVRHRLTL